MPLEIGYTDTRECSFDKKTGQFHIYSEAFGGSFPRRVRIKSMRTGREVEFKPIEPGHPMFNEDGWDGEAQVYEPVEKVPGITVLTITHAY